MSEANSRGDGFNEAICVEAERIYDSCTDRDCMTDLLVTINPGYSIDSSATIVKSKCARIADICINVEPVPFNSGFYSVDITYIFDLTFETYETPCGSATEVIGTATYSKKVILFGSEGSTQTFTSTDTVTPPQNNSNNCCCNRSSLPKASVQVAAPIVLESKLVNPNFTCGQSLCERCERADGGTNNGCGGNTGNLSRCIFVTIGVFSIVQLSRPVSVLIPAYNFCIPEKECTGASNDTPCEIFDKISFPTNVFFPPSLNNDEDLPSGGCGCGC